MDGRWTLTQIQDAAEEMVREDDYSPEAARKRIAELLRAAGETP